MIFFSYLCLVTSTTNAMPMTQITDADRRFMQMAIDQSVENEERFAAMQEGCVR